MHLPAWLLRWHLQCSHKNKKGWSGRTTWYAKLRVLVTPIVIMLPSLYVTLFLKVNAAEESHPMWDPLALLPKNTPAVNKVVLVSFLKVSLNRSEMRCSSFRSSIPTKSPNPCWMQKLRATSKVACGKKHFLIPFAHYARQLWCVPLNES